MNLRLEIDRYLRRNPHLSATAFSVTLSGDRAFIGDLRRGREMKPATEERLCIRMSEILEEEKGVS